MVNPHAESVVVDEPPFFCSAALAGNSGTGDLLKSGKSGEREA